MPARYLTRFISFAKFILIVVYLLVIAGSVVRSTGSGMGCPDWPKCFGKWVPPTDVSQLPSNYKEIFKTKNFEVAEFSAVHTWTEYVNRLLGVLLGLFVFVQFIWSFFMVKFDRKIFAYSFVQLLLLGFQGWLGSKVVSSNLAAAKITGHMVVALIIIAVQIIIIHRSKIILKIEDVRFSRMLKALMVFALLLSLIQILIGTEVREEIDKIVFNTQNQHRETWIALLGGSFKIHRILAFAVLIVNGLMFYLIKKNHSKEKKINTLAICILNSIVLQIFLGTYMAWFAIPPFSQPMHLLLATIMFGLQFALAVRMGKNRWEKIA
jgi:heme a synthase